MSNSIQQSQTLVQDQKTIGGFLSTYRVSELLKQCNAYKFKGYSVIEIFTYLLSMMFSPVSTYMSMRIGSFKEQFSKNTIYRFCNNASINWRKFLRTLSFRVVNEFMDPATSKERVNYFIFDDTPFQKFGKKTELVSKFFNHVDMKYMYGFRVLTMAWSDGYSCLPVDYVPLASSKEDLVRCPAKKLDRRTIAGRNRTLAQTQAPELIKTMLRNAAALGFKANYVLFDSWFSTPKGIIDIKNGFSLDVIAMVKKSGKVFYEYNDEQLSIKQIYARSRKRPGRSSYLLSVNVNLLQKEGGKVIQRLPAKIVCVRNRSNKKDWVAIITTDVDLSENEIIRHYGNRWNIEQMFKVCKQYLKFTKENNSTSFDALMSHLAIVFVRYIMLAVYERSNSDERSLGELFYMFVAEAEEITFSNALNLIYTALLESVAELFTLTEEQRTLLVERFMSKLPEWLKRALLRGAGQVAPAA